MRHKSPKLESSNGLSQRGRRRTEGSPRGKKSGSRATRRKGTDASRADKYILYQRSVQVPEHEVHIFGRFFRAEYSRPPLVLREDFCAAAAVCAAWAKSRPDRRAIGVDLDPEPLAWGREHNLSKLSASARSRVELVQADVRTAKTIPADVISAQNFSFYVFHARGDLLAYFRAVHKSLGREGLFVLDMLGGPDCQKDDTEESRKVGRFWYVWEQTSYDPIHNHGVFKIHFRFKDGSELKNAFEYRWRMWTIPEVREVLLEAGFRRADVYWEGSTRGGRGNDIYTRKERGTADAAWVAYLVGVK